LTLDLHLPVAEDSSRAEVVILLHGGGWVSGDKSFLKPTVDILKNQRKNLAIVNINYRVSSGKNNLLSLQLADLADVVDFLINNADKYNIRKDRFRLTGFSAGGHIALTYAYKSTDTTIGAIVAVSAPTELSLRAWLDKTLWSKVELLTGYSYGGPIDIFKDDSPFYLATPRSPRTILVYGEADELVSPRQGELLADKLKLLRVPYAYHLVLGETHELSARKAAEYIMEAYQ
uniref:alpha/beta hydrolase fold domain-containing protein n=1 Tax=Persicitalea sp. TaxID=3100273 RepID=UPI0035932ADF